MTRGLRIAPLDRKLLRDLWAMKGQALAIAAVLTAGVTMFVAYRSNFQSLHRTQQAYYERYRFADVFASAARVPDRMAARIGAIPGVRAAAFRVVADVTLDVPGFDEPVKGRLLGVEGEDGGELNQVCLRKGRLFEEGREDEVVLSEAFALAHGLEPGDQLAALVNGRRRRLRVVGHGLSPEYVYVIPPGDLIPDDRRFGIVWMDRRSLGSAYDMEGAFNDVSLALLPGATPESVIAELDRLLAPYGGLGAAPRRLQISHWTLDNELRQLASFGTLVPGIFLSVAAFLINMALTRALAIQRPQIASLKALGYANREIAWHYVKWGLAIAVLGGVAGIAFGAWMGSGMINLYNVYFRFPELDYRLSAGVAAKALAVGLATAAAGALLAVRRAVAIPPAEAMRPEPPALFRRSVVERVALLRRLSHATRMVLRNVERHPGRAGASVLGIAFAVGIMVFGVAFLDAMTLLADVQFSLVQRQDVTVSFVEPLSASALHELEALPGVLQVEPLRSVPVRLRNGHRSRQLALSGQVAEPELLRVVGGEGREARAYRLDERGLLLSRILGSVLGVVPGDEVEVEVLEGARPVRRLPVMGLVDDQMGIAASLEIGALHDLMREGGTLTGATLRVDDARLDELQRRLKGMAKVAGIAVTAASRESFRRLMAQNFEIVTAFNVGFAAIIAFGVVYNAARISLSERSHELASLRVLGFTVGEISLILLGELALLTLVAIPPGFGVGWALARVALLGFNSEVYRIPMAITVQGLAWSALTVMAAAFVSALAVRRKLDHLDLVAVLKVKE